MKNIISFFGLAVIMFGAFSVIAQDEKKVNPEHINVYRAVPVIIENEYSLKLSDIVSKMDYAKLAVDFENKTNDFLLYKTEETTFKYAHGDYIPAGKTLILEPGKKRGKTYKVDGDSRFHDDKYTIVFDGFYRIPISGAVQKADDFQLPEAKNEFDAGAFHLKLIKVSQTTSETAVQFEVTYNGDKVGIFNPSNLVCKIPAGQEFANDNKKADPEVMLHGETNKFTCLFHVPGKIADMQKVILQIVWKNTFVESVPQKLKPQLIEVEVDTELTQAKNN